MTPDEVIATVERLRAMGARRVRVGDIDVEFGERREAAPQPAPERIPAEERERQRREAEDSLIYAACG